MRFVTKGLLALVIVLPALAVEEPKTGNTDPLVVIIAGPGRGTGAPLRKGCGYTGGGNVEVSQPSPDTLLISMTGAAAAKCHPCIPTVSQFSFDLTQEFAVAVNDPKVKNIKLVMWGRTVGLLRSGRSCCNKNGTAEISTPGQATVSYGLTELLSLHMPLRGVSGGQNLSVHDREGPVWTSVVPGKYRLHQVFGISASQSRGVCGKPAAAEFAPEPALDSEWSGKKDPFHGAAKKDLGFQVILKVVADEPDHPDPAKP